MSVSIPPVGPYQANIGFNKNGGVVGASAYGMSFSQKYNAGIISVEVDNWSSFRYYLKSFGAY